VKLIKIQPVFAGSPSAHGWESISNQDDFSVPFFPQPVVLPHVHFDRQGAYLLPVPRLL
jgi:hypothetical protein